MVGDFRNDNQWKYYAFHCVLPAQKFAKWKKKINYVVIVSDWKNNEHLLHWHVSVANFKKLFFFIVLNAVPSLLFSMQYRYIPL